MATATGSSKAGRRLARRGRDERGAVVIIFGLALIELQAMIATVALSDARQDRRQMGNQC
jgi:hypothetical protein